MINNNYVKKVYEKLESKYSHEKEFLQAAKEVLETLAMTAYHCEHPFWKRPFKGTSWRSSG